MRIPRYNSKHESYYLIEPPGVSFRLQEPREATDSPRHCILLHGWNSPCSYMDELQNALQNLSSAQQWHFWQVEYPTHLWSFERGAKEIMRVLKETCHDFTNTIFIGYSMGGIVARRMVADGFPCQSLISICSPHQGLARWIMPHSPGTWSLSRWSQSLRQLNNNQRDKDLRSRYHFYAITYHDRFGYHPHDGIVTQNSALGKNLASVATRQTIALDYEQKLGGSEPHLRGMNPRYLEPLLDKCKELFENTTS